jgi:iron complex outermembrane recepter protein
MLASFEGVHSKRHKTAQRAAARFASECTSSSGGYRARQAVRAALRCMIVLTAAVAWAQQPELSQMSIEDLMNITVTSANKREQKLNETAAAVYIITQEAIQHSGMTSIPELLRMVPGMSVAQINASTWAISSRGSGGRFANRLLVLIDGRSVYTPTFSGVYWDVQDLMLEDIERIEVIRGPGATLWGANAVNGVINIITKKASESQGTLISTGLSLTDQRSAAVRYGGKLGQEGYFRVYGKYFLRDGLVYADGSGASDGWNEARGGFRGDYKISHRDNVTFQGDMYGGTVGQRSYLFGLNPLVSSVDEQVGLQGANLVGRWIRTSSERSEFSLQGYIDTTRRNELLIGQRVTTVDFEFQHHRALGQQHDMVWGLGYRRVDDKLRNSEWGGFIPAQQGTNLFSGFVQDEIALLKRRLRVTIGSKFEHNDYTGFEAQPNLRTWFAITPRHHVWASVSRAIRTPAQAEEDVQMNVSSGLVTPFGPMYLAKVFGNHTLTSEKLLAYEAGYRWEMSTWLTLDLAGFYNAYQDGTSAELGMPSLEMTPLPPHLLIPVELGNKNWQRAFGTETAVNVRIAKWWKVSASHTWEQINKNPSTLGGNVAMNGQFTGDTPHQIAAVRSTFLLPRNVDIDVATYYASRIVEPQVPGYTRLDVRLGWRPSRDLELSAGGQNLLEDQHAEYTPVLGLLSTEVRRNAYMRATWHF